MNNNSNRLLTPNAQSLRRNMTPQERHIWYDFLKTLPYTINRQKTVGKYIVDFYCAEVKLAIELDGSQHFEEDGRVKDRQRDEFLENKGMTILRYSNGDVDKNFSGVCEDILRHIEQRKNDTSSVAKATASPQGEAKETQ